MYKYIYFFWRFLNVSLLNKRLFVDLAKSKSITSLCLFFFIFSLYLYKLIIKRLVILSVYNIKLKKKKSEKKSIVSESFRKKNKIVKKSFKSFKQSLYLFNNNNKHTIINNNGKK